MSDSIILDEPWQIEMFHLLQMKYALRIEVKTGLRHSRGSVLKLVNDTLMRNNFTKKPLGTKAAALKALEEYISMKQEAILNG